MQTLYDLLNPDGPQLSSESLDPAIRALRTGYNQAPVSSWEPLPGPQTMAAQCQADELYYGGQAGGGKTDLLLGIAGIEHQRTIIFRRIWKEFKEMLDRAEEIYGDSGGAYNTNLKIFKLPYQKSIEFASIEHHNDISGFKGRAHDLKAWDEVSEFTEYMFRFVNAWNRSTIPGQRCRVIATGNPPTSAEGEWVIRYWGPWLDKNYPNPAAPGELRWFAVVDGKDTEIESGDPFEHNGEMIFPRSRTFIPAALSDNPYLERTGYRAVLQGLPEPLRSQMLYGDHTIGMKDDARQVIPTAWIQKAMNRWTLEGKPDVSLSALGVDVSRGGKDQMVLAPRFGNWFGPLEKHEGAEVPDGPAAAAIVAGFLSGRRAWVMIDVIGVGCSPYDNLRGNNAVNVLGLNSSERSDATDRSGMLCFVNKRAEWYWKMREALDPENGDNIALPPDPQLSADLAAPRFDVRSNGIQVEKKIDIIKRLGRSPDCGDAVVYAHAEQSFIVGKVISAGVISRENQARGYSGSAGRYARGY